MGELDSLKPRDVFHFFEEITKIPRPSYKEKAISDYLVAFAKERGLFYKQDEDLNVIIVKPAAENYEDLPPVIIQAHMDMVCAKDPGVDKDMDKEGLDVKIEGNYVYAEGTSLGGDDGIGLAIGLALLDDRKLKAPKIEFVATTAEETGLEGATDIDLSCLEGKRLINVDSEEEGKFIVGCAGGSSVSITASVEEKEVSGTEITLKFEGFQGGHSGMKITDYGANAIKALARVLTYAIQRNPLRIESLLTEGKDNAIPTRSSAKIIVDSEDREEIINDIKREADNIINEYSVSDPDLKFTYEIREVSSIKAARRRESRRISGLLMALPNGVIRMSRTSPGIPETSLSAGVLSYRDGQFEVISAVRSSFESARYALERQMKLIAERFDAEFNSRFPYPAWEFKRKSPFRDEMVWLFKEMFGYEPKIEVTHGGLECGIIAQKIEGLECVSIGPNLLSVHTAEEKLDIASTERTYKYIRKVLESR